MAPDDVWTVPSEWPTQPPTNDDHGYIEYPLANITRQYFNLAANVKARQLSGISYNEEFFEDVNRGIYNDYLRWLYWIARKHRRFERFCTGLLGWQSGHQPGSDDGGAPVDVSRFLATGSGSTIDIFFNESSNHPRGLFNSGGSPNCLCSGMFAMDQRFPSFSGISEIIDVEFTSQGSARVSLHPNKPLNSAFEGGALYIVKPNLLGGFPAPRLHLPESAKKDPPQCIFARRQQCKIFSSFRAWFPDAPMAKAIDDEGFVCTLMNSLNETELDGFQATAPRCNFKACRFYQPYVVSMPSPSDIYNFLIGKGEYIRQLGPGGGGANFNQGRIGFAGLWTLHDLGTIPANQPAIENRVEFLGDGVLKFDTEEQDENGFRKYQTFAEIAKERGDGSDDIGLISTASSGVSKQAPDGGLSPGNKSIPASYPSSVLSEAMGIRRSGGLAMSDFASPSGFGENDVQRVMRKSPYTSPAFSIPAVVVDVFSSENETRIIQYEDGQVGLFPITGFIPNMIFQNPKQGDVVMDSERRTQVFKDVAGVVAGAALISGLLTLTFFLEEEISIFPSDAFPPGTAASNWSCGGNVVASNAALTITNSGSRRTSNTDPQKLIYPGDAITINAPGMEGIGAIVVAATAFGGEEIPGAIEPREGVPGIPDALRNVHKHGDTVVLKIDVGSNGEKWQAFFESGGFDNQDVQLATVGHQAISPVRDTYTPVLELIAADGTETTIPGEQYRYDPATGTFHIQTAGWEVGDGFRLAATTHVFDTRRTLPISNMQALSDGLSNFVDGFRDGGGSFTSFRLELIGKVDGKVVPFPELISHWETYSTPIPGLGTGFATTYDITFGGLDNSRFIPVQTGGIGGPIHELNPNFVLGASNFVTNFIGLLVDEEAGLSKNLPELIVEVEYNLRCSFLALLPGATLYGSSDLSKATVDFEYRNAVVTESFGEWNKEAYDDAPDKIAYWEAQWTRNQIIATPRLGVALAVMEQVTQFEYKVLWIGSAASVSTVIVTSGDETIHKGTADISAIYGEALDIMRENDSRFIAFLPGGPFQVVAESSLDPRKMASSWVKEWSGVFEGEPLDDYTPGRVWTSNAVHYSWMTVDNISVSNLQIQFLDGALETGADFYVGPAATEAATPNLNALPQ